MLSPTSFAAGDLACSGFPYRHNWEAVEVGGEGRRVRAGRDEQTEVNRCRSRYRSRFLSERRAFSAL